MVHIPWYMNIFKITSFQMGFKTLCVSEKHDLVYGNDSVSQSSLIYEDFKILKEFFESHSFVHTKNDSR